MTISIGNVRAGDVGEYVGRATRGRKASPLANPFRMYDQGDDAEREHVIGAYRTWLAVERDGTSHTRFAVEAELDRLRELAERPEGVTLLCWCAPKACHASVIREVLLSDG